MNLLKDCFAMVNKLCKNDDVCLMLFFIFIGVMLCYLFKDSVTGYINFASIDGNSVMHSSDSVAPSLKAIKGDITEGIKNVNSEKTIGIELKPRKPDPTPSTQKQLEVIAKKPPVQQVPVDQKTGLLVQAASIFKPFDEVWNPGFMPLDMVFKNVQKAVSGSMVPTSPSPTKGLISSLEGEVNLVLVYAPWCGHSKNMLSDYERIKSEFHGKVINGKKINIRMHNSDVEKDKVKEYGVKGFPSLFIEKNGNRESFPHRTYDKISEYLNSL